MPRAYHVMVKPRGAICNLECAYCYFLAKEQLYPDSRFRMSDATLESFTQQYIESQPAAPEVTFAWQGGEPTLMGLDFFRRAVELQQKYRRPGLRISNAIQTNATTLDADWCDFFRRHDFLLGISLDGPREIHDFYRRDKGGRPTFDRVMAGLRLAQEHGVEFNILCTVHAANAPHPVEVYRFFRDEVAAQGPRETPFFIQFIPIVERDNETGYSPERGLTQEGTQVTARSVQGARYGEFLIGVFDEWVRRDVGRVYVQLFDTALAAWLGERPGLCVYEETCGAALVMEHNGDLFACDHFVEPRCLLGNISDTALADLVASQQQHAFGMAKWETLPAYCRRCEVRFVCNGECQKNRIRTTPDGEPGLNYLCEGLKLFFTHIDAPMRFMANELRNRRPPANIMYFLAEQERKLEAKFARTGRNEPCPCGSGKKFKQCHGRRTANDNQQKVKEELTR